MVSFLIGYAIGFVGSMPIGPINAILISKSLQEGFRQAFVMACGVIIGEVIYNSLAIYGAYSFLMEPPVRLIFQFVALPLLLYYGIHAYRHPYESPRDLNKVEAHHATFLFGLILYLSNPLFLAFWLAAIQVLYHQQLVERGLASVFYVSGCTLGALTWLYILTRLIHSNRHYFERTTIQRLSRFSGILILIFACILGFRILQSLV